MLCVVRGGKCLCQSVPYVCFLSLALCFHTKLRILLCYGHSSCTDEQSFVFAGLGGIAGAQYSSSSYTSGNYRESRLYQ